MLAAIRGSLREDRRDEASATSRFHSTGQVRSCVARTQEEDIVAGSVQDQAARDDAHLQSLGIKPELRRSLGFLSNFAVAFSYISVSTGTITEMGLALTVSGPI